MLCLSLLYLFRGIGRTVAGKFVVGQGGEVARRRGSKAARQTVGRVAVLLTTLILLPSYLATLQPAQAAGINKAINFQGKVTNSNGTNVTDGTYDFVFKLYNAPTSAASAIYTESWSSSALWSSTMSSAPASGGESLTYSSNTNESTIKAGQILWNTTKKESVKVVSVNTATNVIAISPTKQAWSTGDTVTNKIYVQNGIFSVAINTLNADFSGVDFNNDQLFLGINFNGDGEMKPRVQFTAAPYALNSEKVNGLSVTNTSGSPVATGTTLKIADSKTVTFNNGLAFSGVDGKTFTLNNSLTFAGADSKTITFGNNNLTFSTSADSSLTLPTTGTLATLAGSEALTNKTVNGLNITSTTGTLTVASGKTLTASNTLTFTGSDGSSVNFGTGGTVCYSGGCAASSVRLDQIAAASTTATIANGSNAIAWNWGTLTTQTGMTFGGGTAMTTGSVLALGSGTYVHTALNDVGSLAKITFSDSSTNTNNGGVTNGLNIAATINTSGAGTKTINSLGISAPTLTACASGGCTVNGAQINTATSGAAATITQNGLAIVATGVASGALNGISIGSIIGAAGTETAMAIGSGWDNVLTVGGTAVINGSGQLLLSQASGTLSNSNLTNSGALTVTAGTGLSGGGSIALGGSATVNLANTTVTLGSYGSASSVATFTVDGQGRLTAASNAAIAIAGSQITSGAVAVAQGGTGTGSLTGLVKGNGTSAFSAATAGTDYSAGTSALGTGILKSTTGTGALSIAVAADFPTLNQNTTGNAATATNVALSGITAASTTQTIANGSNAIAWNWGSLTTQTGMTMGGGTAMTTGSVLALGSGTYVHTALNDVGSLAKITFSDSSTNANNGGVTNGLNIAATVNTSGAGTKTINGVNVAAPTLTGCATGGCTVNGAQINTATSGAASTITQNGLSIVATGVSTGTLTGINIGGITAAGGTETAMVIGAGWDNALTVGGTAILNGSGVLQSAGLSGTYSNALTLSNASNSIAGATFNGLAITNNGTNTLAIAAGKTLTASNSLTLAGTDGKTLNIGANNLTFTTSGATTLTLPTSGTLSTLAGTEALTNKSLNGLTVTTAVATTANYTKSGDGVGGLMYSGSADTWSYLARGSNGQCLTSNSTTITWGACGNTIMSQGSGFAYLTSTTDGVVFGGTTTAGGDFWFDTANANLYLGVDALQNGGLTFRSAGSSITDPTITTNSNGDLLLSAPSGQVALGSGTGNITMSLTNSTDLFKADKTLTLSGALSSTDFTYTRNLTAGANAAGGAVFKINDTSSGSSTINPDMLVIDAHPTSGTFSGNLLRLENGGTDKFVINSAGNVTTGGTYNGLTISSSTGTLTLANSKTLTVNNTLTFSGTDSTSFTLPSTSGTLATSAATSGQLAFSNGTGTLTGDSNLTWDNTNKYLGVGSATPNAKLSLGSDVTAQKLLLYDTSLNRYGLGIASSQMRIFAAGAGNIVFGNISSSDGTTFTETMRLDSSGHLGLGGATNPGATLDLGTGTMQGAGLSGDCSASSSKLLWSSTSKQFSCGTDRASVSTILSSNATSTTTTLGNVTGMNFGVAANEQWIWNMMISINSPAAAGVKYQINGPTSPTSCLWNYMKFDATATSSGDKTCGTVSPTLATSGTGDDVHLLSGTINNGANAGSIQLQFAEATASGTATIHSGASHLVAFKVNGADLAEIYNTKDPSIEPGDVVAVDPSMQAGVQKTTGTYQQSALGVISTQPGQVLGNVNDHSGRPVVLGLSGRVPVKVSAENGAILPGDYLTSSSTPGVAMKATKAGSVIGKAMEPYNGDGIGKINVFLNLSWADPQQQSAVDMVTADDTQTTQLLSNLKVSANTVTVGSDLQVNGKLSAMGGLTVAGPAEFKGPAIFRAVADFFDNVIFHKDATFQQNVSFAKSPTFNKDTAGSAIIRMGTQSVHVSFDQPFAATPVISTTLNSGPLRSDSYMSYINANLCTVAEGPVGCEKKLKAKLLGTDVHFVVSDQDANGFTVELDKPAEQDLKFNWTAIQVNNLQETVSTPTPTPAP